VGDAQTLRSLQGQTSNEKNKPFWTVGKYEKNQKPKMEKSLADHLSLIARERVKDGLVLPAAAHFNQHVLRVKMRRFDWQEAVAGRHDHALSAVELISNSLTHLPTEVLGLAASLRSLTISWNLLESIPASIGRLKHVNYCIFQSSLPATATTVPYICI